MNDFMKHIDVAVSGISFIVYVLITRKIRWGFVLGIFNQVLWALFMIQTQAWGLTGSILLFIGINIYGLWHWTKEPPKGAACLNECCLSAAGGEASSADSMMA